MSRAFLAKWSDKSFFKNLLVYASIAWTIASTPEKAVGPLGKVKVVFASRIAQSENSDGDFTPCFAPDGFVKTLISVTSDPVPAVVGI